MSFAGVRGLVARLRLYEVRTTEFLKGAEHLRRHSLVTRSDGSAREIRPERRAPRDLSTNGGEAVGCKTDSAQNNAGAGGFVRPKDEIKGGL